MIQKMDPKALQQRWENLETDRTERTFSSDGLSLAFRLIIFSDMDYAYIFIRASKQKRNAGKWLKVIPKSEFTPEAMFAFIHEFSSDPGTREPLRSDFSCPLPSKERTYGVRRSFNWPSELAHVGGGQS